MWKVNGNTPQAQIKSIESYLQYIQPRLHERFAVVAPPVLLCGFVETADELGTIMGGVSPIYGRCRRLAVAVRESLHGEAPAPQIMFSVLGQQTSGVLLDMKERVIVQALDIPVLPGTVFGLQTTHGHLLRGIYWGLAIEHLHSEATVQEIAISKLGIEDVFEEPVE